MNGMKTYVIQNTITKNVKIGRGRNPEARLRMLQTGNDSPLEIIHAYEGDIETFLHNYYDEYKVPGGGDEWYLPKCLETIDEVAAKQLHIDTEIKEKILRPEELRNILFYGDNLDVMRKYLPDKCVDLIYIDPPFKSQRLYNVFFKEENGNDSTAQVQAFTDTWKWNEHRVEEYDEIMEIGGNIAQTMVGFRTILKESSMMAYLTFMCIRLIEMRRILKDNGSFYLHCDSNANAYLRVLCDQIFGDTNFRNDIIWNYGAKASQNYPTYQPKHDTILFYTKSGTFTFKTEYQEYSEASLAERVTRYKFQDENGRYRETTRRDSEGRKYRAKVYLHGGVAITDVWDIPIINATSKERLGYPTQKPIELLDRIINVSSNKEDVVCDLFCGCGTTVASAENNQRRWIGVDVTHLAINLIKSRLADSNGDLSVSEKNVITIGDPTTLNEAKVLAKENKEQFKYWVFSKLHAFPVNIKKFINVFDGFRNFANTSVVYKVELGEPTAETISDFARRVSSAKTQMGIFVTFARAKTVIKALKDEAMESGDYNPGEVDGKQYPVIQVLTVEELLEGVQPNLPRTASVATEDRTVKHTTPRKKGKKRTGTQKELF